MMTDINFVKIFGDIETNILGSIIKRNMRDSSGNMDFTKKVLVIVPDSLTLGYEQSIIRELKSMGFIGVTVMSPKQLQTNIFESAGYGVTNSKNEINHVSMEGKTIRFNEIVNKLSEKDLLSFFKKPFRTVAVHRITSTIEELKLHGYDAESLRKLAACEDIPPLRKNKFLDIANLMEAYDKKKKKTELDDDELWSQMCDRVKYCDFLKESHVVFVGFAYLYTKYRKLLTNIAPVAASVNFIIHCFECNTEAFDGAASSIESYIKSIEKAKERTPGALFPEIKVSEAVYESKPGSISAPSLAYLSKSVVGIPCSSDNIDFRNVETYQASTQYYECLHVAQKLIQWHKDGYEWKQMAVACPKSSAIRSILPHVLKQAGIPSFYREEDPLVLSGAAYFLEQCIRCVCDNYKQENVISLMKSGYTSLTQDEIMRLQNYANEKGITGSKWTKPFRHMKSVPNEVTDSLNELRVKLISPLEELHKNLFKNVSVSAVDQMTILYNFLIDNSVYEKMREEASNYLNSGMNKEADFIRQAWESIERCLNIIAQESFDGTHLSIQTLGSFIPLMLSQAVIKFIPQTANEVVIDYYGMFVPAQETCVAIIGDQDQVLTSEITIITEEDKRWMEAHDHVAGNVLPFFDLTNSRNASETKRVYQDYYRTIIAATERLYVSNSLVSHDGKELQPGELFTTVIKLLKEKKINENIRGGLITNDISPYCKDVAIEVIAEQLRQYHEYGTGAFDPSVSDDSTWKNALGYLQNKGEKTYTSVEKALNAKVASENIDPKIASRLYADNISSVSDIEKYASCPYRHFVTHGLRAKVADDYSFKDNAEGIFIHAALSNYMNEAMKDPDFPGLTHKQIVSIYNKAIEPLLEEVFSGPLADSVLDRMVANEIIQKGRTVAEAITVWFTKTDFRPTHCEMLFSDDSYADIPAVNIHLNNGKMISLKGRIDRVDEYIGPDGKLYKRAVDYKKSSHDLNRDAVEKGYQLQLMTYLLALKDADPSCVPSGALYQHVHDPVIETDSTDKEEVRAEIVKKIRLNGLVLDDAIVKKANGESVSSSGRASKKLESLDAAEMDKTIESVRDSIKRHLENIYEGHIEIEPVQIVNTSPCKYCDHRTVCGFDPRLPGGCVKDIYGNTVQEIQY